MQQEIRKDKVVGSRRFSNYLFSFLLLVGGLGFLLAGISSYLKTNLLPFSDLTKLTFIPQGLIMMFYGTLSFGISLYILFTIYFDIGSGYNEYNQIENLVKIVRKGFPGKNREILLTYSLSNVKSIGIRITEGLNPIRNIYLCLKDDRIIPLTSSQESITISNLEKKAASLAKFLNLKLETL